MVQIKVKGFGVPAQNHNCPGECRCKEKQRDPESVSLAECACKCVTCSAGSARPLWNHTLDLWISGLPWCLLYEERMRGDDLLVLCLLTQDVECAAVLVVVGVFLGPHVESHLSSVMAFATAVT